MLEVHQYPYNSDNYGVLLHHHDNGQTVAVDCGDATAALEALSVRGWSLQHILLTHHHADHSAGLEALKAATGAQAIGPGTASNVPGLDRTVTDGDTLELLGQRVEVLHTPGHTLDMMNFYWPESKLLFSGDTLFVLGCGRVFEGDMNMMWRSLSKLAALPPDTVIYCSHEYSEANARFALSVDPNNAELHMRAREISEQRARGEATVPTRLDLELKTNPFLRVSDSELREQLGMQSASDAEVFAELRRRKDVF